MKKLIRLSVFNLAALFISSYLVGGIKFADYTVLVKAAVLLTLVNLLIKPLINLLLLPINLLTLGTFRWLANVAALYIVTVFVPQLKITNFYFSGFTSQGFTIPALSISLFWSYFITSFLISLIVSLLIWLTE